MFTVLLGTGCRIGEALGLRWQDLDYDRRTISINHSLSYYQKPESNKSVLRISKPKTEAGIRTIPMLDVVKDSFEMLYEEQLENGFNETEIDGMSGFIFCNRFGTVPNPQTVNHTIKRIANSYNADEVVRAKKERRDPIILPNFSCHHLRHTFCTRLCENETNLKVIQSIMGHRNIETTMDIYAEATEEKKQESKGAYAAELSSSLSHSGLCDATHLLLCSDYSQPYLRLHELVCLLQDDIVRRSFQFRRPLQVGKSAA